ncbi:MAG: hypothetical protein CSB33_03175 [Desulfobacterales bacterium]|nr:MAG: hypothetical protein CSB33_03175 [Desulfobacterales bacterium]
MKKHMVLAGVLAGVFGLVMTADATNFEKYLSISETPFSDTELGTDHKSFAFLDYDGDGDLDAFVGRNKRIDYFRNDGTAAAPDFVKVTGTENPFDGVSFSDLVRIAAADIVEDTENYKDIVVCEFDGNEFKVYEYKDDPSPSLTDAGVLSFPGFNMGSHTIITPAFYDVNKDGIDDALIGLDNGTTKYYRGTASFSGGIREFQTPATDPFNGKTVVSSDELAAPALADINGDELDDFVVGGQTNIVYFLGQESGGFGDRVLASGFSGNYQAPVFIDIDNDSQLELFVGQAGANFSNSGYWAIKYIPELSHVIDGLKFMAGITVEQANLDAIDVVVTDPKIIDLADIISSLRIISESQ